MNLKFYKRNAVGAERQLGHTNYHWLTTAPKLWLPRIGNEFVISDQRVFVKTGIFSTNIRNQPLAQIENVYLKQSLVGRLFGWGNISIHGTGGHPIELKNVATPLKFYNACLHAIASRQLQT